MASLLDTIAQADANARYITLALRDSRALRRAFTPIDITVTLQAAALADGLALPLELTIQSPTQVTRKYFYRVVPAFLSFTPREGGDHLVRLGEVHHNAWWGSLLVSVTGDPLTT